MWRCEIEDLSPLSGLTSLEFLHLYGNEIEDVSPLSGLTSLEELHLARNSISDVGPLSGLVNLTLLHLFGNEVEDVSPLSGLTSLIEIHLHGNRVDDVSPLSGLTSLEELHLGINFITDVSPLTGLVNVELVHLYGNDIEDISPLLENEGLDEGDELDISGNPLSDESLETHVPALEERGVDVEFIPAPLAPTGLTTRVWGPDTIGLTWAEVVSTTREPTTGYIVESSPSADGPWAEVDCGPGANRHRILRHGTER